MRLKKLAYFCILSLMISFSLPAYACTEWAAAGNAVVGGGTLIIKNRDWKPQFQELKLTKPDDGYRYFGIVAKDIEGMSKGGINEHGLVVFNQAASTVPASGRKNITPYLTDILLKKCKSVDEVIALLPQLSGPIFLNVADKDKVANIEIGTDGEDAYIIEDNGVIYHTNHFLDQKLQKANSVDYPSSYVRYSRIKELLSKSSAYTLKDFIEYSKDQNDGPDNSIWRTGSKSNKARTLATFAVRLPKQGAAEVYIVLANPGEELQTFHLQAEDIFSGRVEF